MPLSLSAVEEWRRALLDDVCPQFWGAEVRGEVFFDLTSACSTALGLKRPAARAAVADSLRPLAGGVLTAAAAAELSWRLAGNVHRLRKGEAVPEWCRQIDEEWSPAEVEAVSPTRRVFRPRGDDARAAADGLVHQAGFSLSLRLLAGSPAGRVARVFWSNELCHVYKQSFGYSRVCHARYSRAFRAHREYPFLDPREFFGMRVNVLVDPTTSQPPHQVGFRLIADTPAMVAHNRRLMVAREREDFACPRGYQVDAVPCWQCPAGRDECPAACRAVGCVAGDCPSCGGRGVWLDGGARPPVCLDCAGRAR